MIYSIFLLLSDVCSTIPSYFLNIEAPNYYSEICVFHLRSSIFPLLHYLLSLLLFTHVFVMGVLENLILTISIICITLEEIIMIILLKSPFF